MRELERDPSRSAGALAGPASMPALVLVGAGRVGTSLTKAAMRVGLSAELAGRAEAPEAALRAEAALLCVPDDAIGEACESLANAIPPLRLVGHTSGAAGLDVLDAARRRGALTFSLHPLQTVPDGDTDLTGAPCAVSGDDPQATEFASALAERLGMRPFIVPDERRAAYHAAAVIASNFLVALEESATELAGRAGVEEPREVLAPLVLRAAANWAERGAGALTGPIARGDEATVAAHLEALRDIAPELMPLYEALAERTRALAAQGRAGE